MQSMVSVKFALFVAALVVAHLSFVNNFKISDRDMAMLTAGKEAIKPPRSVDALLVGGSGVHYGLNARILSEETSFEFLNLALILEGGSWQNYLDFLGGLEMLVPEEIEVILYSSQDFYDFQNEEGVITLTGARPGFMLFDRESWLQRPFGRGPEFGPRSADRTVIDPETGDMVFYDGICDIYYEAVDMMPPGGDIAPIAARVADLEQLFPNARILIRPWPISEHRGHPLAAVHRELAEGLRARGVEVFLPPMPLYPSDWACDAAFHPTAQGRDTLSRIEAEALGAFLASVE